MAFLIIFGLENIAPSIQIIVNLLYSSNILILTMVFIHKAIGPFRSDQSDIYDFFENTPLKGVFGFSLIFISADHGGRPLLLHYGRLCASRNKAKLLGKLPEAYRPQEPRCCQPEDCSVAQRVTTQPISADPRIITLILQVK